jgi:hypothetical protein
MPMGTREVISMSVELKTLKSSLAGLSVEG